jgi:hypothetical protein
MDPLKLQSLIDNRARTIATEVYNKLGTKYNVAQVPTHTHNGIDSVKINEENLINGVRYIGLLDLFWQTGDPDPASLTFQLRNVVNPTNITFKGFAANNSEGNPVSKRATVDGEVTFGTCYQFQGIFPNVDIITTGLPFVQGCNYLYTDTTSLANTRVGASPAHLVLVVDDTGTTVASLVLDTYKDGLLTLTVTVAEFWRISGTIIIK